MKAIVKYGELPGEVDLREIEEPACADNEVKIEVRACAICVTDLHIIAGEYPWEVGVPLGHEFCGVVVEVGKNVKEFSVGERVVSCMNGGFARYVVKDESDWVFHLPDEISYYEGALLEPLAAAANSVIKRSLIRPADHVLIEGPGVIGLFVLQVCKLFNAHVMITGTRSDKKRLELAKSFGADKALTVEDSDILNEAKTFSRGKGIDTVFECSGSQAALDTGLQVLKYDGQLTQVGIFGRNASIDLGQLVYNNRKIIGSIAYDRSMWERVIRMVQVGQVNVKAMISEVLPLDEWERGFRMAKERSGLRIILVP